MNINIKILFLVLTLLLTMSLVSASNETSVVDYDKSIDDNVIVDENFNNGSNNYYCIGFNKDVYYYKLGA